MNVPVVKMLVGPLIGVEAGVGDPCRRVVPPEEQLARRVRQRDAAAEHLEVHHVRRRLQCQHPLKGR